MLTKTHTNQLLTILRDKILPEIDELRKDQGTQGQIVENK